MKNLLLPLVLLFFIGCSKSDDTSSSSSSSTSSFTNKLTIDSRSYDIKGLRTPGASSEYLNGLGKDAFFIALLDTDTSASSDTLTYTCNETYDGNTHYYYDYYVIDLITTKPAQNNIVVKKTTTGYMVSGTVTMYEDADSSKMVAVKVDFTTQ